MSNSEKEKWNEIREAFIRAAPKIDTHHRGGIPGYTHIHGPKHWPKPNTKRCFNHSVVIENYNGTVCFPERLAQKVNANASRIRAIERPKVSIKIHPWGGAGRPNYGRFIYGLTYDDIVNEWATVDKFVMVVIACCDESGDW